MEFERARTKAQKDVRISEIIEAALKQYHAMPFSQITLASISKDLSFSRVNLYKYFGTKQEIFLKILELDMYKWVDKLKLVFMGQPTKNIKDFAHKWASVIYSQKMMMHLMSILYSDLEKNSSVEKMVEFKTSYYELYSEIIEIALPHLSMLKKRHAAELLLMQGVFSMGLYNKSVQTEEQREAQKLAGGNIDDMEFVETLSSFIVTYANGLGK